ncbi:relaxase/mobilization nuclease domain-containing protein [Mucilaginibacter aquaedulcis]|uniref:relaxase/mobilization nuclease domain-containing protein n=1 Tax=Mucilaginibacter aquaedulcis TaxID=1187081 RepID=UPI0025B5A83B|nr:relaxase/mobilization nuclease domain-containing protein [Mucilaginibacter aquaedulcis]MDN3550513.1 relaxase/mobilization nuclease domain-containing protein [Mucilaginibacter aquaedulcis]
MIASQKIGKSFLGALNYNLKKLYHPDQNKRAELLDSSFASIDFRMIQQELRLIKSLKPNLSRYVYHTSLNFSIEDELDNNKLLSIAHDYLKESGYTNNQYMIFRHHDAPHPHIHLLVNRISFDGTVVSDSNNFKRSEDIIRKLERRYNLKTVQSSKETLLKAAKIGEIEQTLRTGKPSDKLILQNKLINILNQGNLSIKELIEKCERQGIHFLFNQASTGNISGITYFHNGFKIKGQALGNRFKWAELIKQINYEQIRDSKAISEANSRTKANCGDQSWPNGELDSGQRGRKRSNEFYTSSSTESYFDEGDSRQADKIGEEGRSKSQRDFEAGEDVYIPHDDSPNNRNYGHYGSYGFEISDEVDDEAIHGRRRKKSQSRSIGR